MKGWTVRSLRDALDDLITRRPAAADHAVLLIDEHFPDIRISLLTEVRPDYELCQTKLVGGVGTDTRRKRHDDSADTADRTRRD